MMRLSEDQLNVANIELEWAVTELPEMEPYSPRNSLHIMRIVQEAVTNIIKHSASRTMKLSTGVASNKVFIEIIDEGKGVDKVSTCMSRGENNMHYRAKQLNAELSVKHMRNGTKVRLVLL